MAIKENVRNWFRKQGKLVIFAVILVMALNFSFGFYNIEKFAAVDEPLWLFERIPEYWKNIYHQNWTGTLINDKPGITVALISGSGLVWGNPAPYKPIIWQGKFYPVAQQDFSRLYFHLRLPIVLFASLSLFLFYYFLEKLLNKRQAIFSLIFIGFSPILLGITRIVNPDSLFWIFSPLAFISFLAYQKHARKSFLYSSGIFLGFALLTKYVANIFFVFFPAVIFLNYIFNKEKYDGQGAPAYFKRALTDYLILLLISVSVFIIFCPAVWFKPSILLKATVMSQAFQPVWMYFAAFFGILLLDIYILKSRFSSLIADFLAGKKTVIYAAAVGLFLAAVFFTFINLLFQMNPIDFINYLVSPKSSHESLINSVKLFITDFYPLIFGISPIALAAIIGGIIYGFFRKEIYSKVDYKTIACFFFFIFIYYIGATLGNIAASIRYQIMLYPIIFIISAIFLDLIFKNTPYLKKMPSAALYLFIIAFNLVSLIKIAPLYAGYASSFLPNKYFIDAKDMGTGSYEAAAYINSLPDSKNLNVWTDKSGVCYFLNAACYTDYELPDKPRLDYLILSSGRESRTQKLSRPKKFGTLDFSKYYEANYKGEYKLEIDGRPEQFVKIINLNSENE